MQTITVDIPGRSQSYPILAGTALLGNIAGLVSFKHYTRAFVVTDEAVGPLFASRITKQLGLPVDTITLPAGETAKNLESVSKIWSAMQQAGCDRKSLVIALGGGVIGDMAGFAASTYMRGVDYLQVPTTLLSQIDSSIGGKTGIDFGGVKNLVGTFAQPVAVVIDTDTLATLSERQLVAGFGEIIKHGLIRDATYLQQVTSKRPQEFSRDELAVLIAGSCRIKAEIVMGDEREAGMRKLVNFGHTIGHAVEALSLETEAPLLHGEAVSIGMVVEAALSARQGLLSSSDAMRITELLQAAGLPVRVPKFAVEQIFNKMKSDKKNVRGELRFILLRALGEAVWDQVVPEEVVEAVIREHQEDRL
ncbi:MAG TPA: 3-dehydroquinate synthase [Candidatus Saccharimonadia bacterium]|jgi:3-dehydroquinate synthase|nr:3-dehydroquinate synthase [Candidatus Saccharimonadia bacterium]